MSTALRTPRMTRDEFLDWVVTQEGHWEFDGFEPVPKFGPPHAPPHAMTGGTRNHSLIARNILVALGTRLKGGPCVVLGSDAGLATTEDRVRYPDALVTCTRGAGTDRLIDGAVIVFEVISPSSTRLDRIVKLREYAAVAAIRRYVILESTTAALTLHARTEAGAPWTATALTEADTLALPEIGIELPVAELFEGVTFDDAEAG